MKVSLKRSIVCGTLRFVAAVVRTRAGPETCRRPLPDKRSGRSVLFPFQCRRGLARRRHRIRTLGVNNVGGESERYSALSDEWRQV
jgi:hypothetical protein